MLVVRRRQRPVRRQRQRSRALALALALATLLGGAGLRAQGRPAAPDPEPAALARQRADSRGEPKAPPQPQRECEAELAAVERAEPAREAATALERRAEAALDCLHERDDLQGLAAAAERLAALRWTTPRFRGRLRELALHARYRLCELRPQSGAGAQCFVALADRHPRAQAAPKALFNAAVLFEKARRLESAAATWRRITEAYPASEVTPRALLALGHLLDAQQHHERAAAAFERYAHAYPAADEAGPALVHAAVLREALGDSGRALKLYGRWWRVRGRARHERAGMVLLARARLAMAAEDHHGALAMLRDAVERHSSTLQPSVRARCLLLEGLCLARLGKRQAALRVFERVGRGSPAKRRFGWNDRLAMSTVGQARFEAAELRNGGRLARPLPRGARALAGFKARIELLERTIAGYAAVLAAKDAEWATAALVRTAESYEAVAAALRRYPGSGPDSLPCVWRGYEGPQGVALLLEERALQAHRRALELGGRCRCATPWVRLALTALARYQPVEYALPEAHVAPAAR